METSVIYERIFLGDVVYVWGWLILALFISTFGFLVGRTKERVSIAWISALISSSVILVFSLVGYHVGDPFGVVEFDKYFFVSAFFISLFSVFSILVAVAELRAKERLSCEYFFFIFLSAVGAVLMTSSRDFLVLFLSKELMSFPIYAMAYGVRDRLGIEAAFKYFIAGALFSLIYLLGISFYLISEESIFIERPSGSMGVIGIYLIIFSLLFKGGTAPFHFWVPDVYQGGPPSMVAFAGSVVKFSSFVALIRVVRATEVEISGVFEVFAVLSLIVGIFGAFVQKEIKRIIAYSSISHSGFILFFLFSGLSAEEEKHYLFYLGTYGMATAGLFGLLSLFRRGIVYLDDVVELSRGHRFISSLMSIFLISFAGIPMTAGFFAKYLAFLSGLQTNAFVPVIVGAVGSVASLYFYFQPISKSFMEERSGERDGEVMPEPVTVFAAFIFAIGLVIFGFFPGLFFTLLEGIPLFF